jgi:thiol-disulfide isomerase/thioredoxin
MYRFEKMFWGLYMRGKMIFRWIDLRLIVFIILLPLFTAYSQSESDTTNEKYVLGPVSWQQWQQEAGWESYIPAEYVPDKSKIKQIESLTRKDEITYYVFSGSWCSDSKSEVPKMFRLFDEANVSPDRIKLYGVDRNKTEPTGTAKTYNIERVPTLVLVKGSKEIGRVTEYPRPEMSWEDEILEIIRK